MILTIHDTCRYARYAVEGQKPVDTAIRGPPPEGKRNLTLGGKSLSTSSRLLTKCFPSVEMLHGVPRTADISSGGHSGKHHDVTGCYALRSSLGIDLTPEAYMSDSMQPPEIASLKNWDGEYVEFQATCWSATHHAAHRFFKLAQVITARGGPEFWVRKVR